MPILRVSHAVYGNNLSHRIEGFALNVIECTALLFNQFAMVRVPVDNGNAPSSIPSFKVTIVGVAQFRPLLKLLLTAANCHPYVCFRDKPCFCSFIEYGGYQKQHALRSGMLNIVIMIMCMTGLLTDNAFIS